MIIIGDILKDRTRLTISVAFAKFPHPTEDNFSYLSVVLGKSVAYLRGEWRRLRAEEKRRESEGTFQRHVPDSITTNLLDRFNTVIGCGNLCVREYGEYHYECISCGLVAQRLFKSASTSLKWGMS